jgi:alkanesulfonate monooxygenase SsuD/methylene tetrahydromethanopterin reductase-like flavin-dependent oxidoreductase (luciferase family)
MASATSRIRLGVHVVNVNLRNPFLLASQVATVQALSRGRVELGLGAGGPASFARADHAALGLPFPPFEQRVARLEHFCRVLPALWRGESVSAPDVGLDGARLEVITSTLPRLVVGGSQPRTLEIAVLYADAWNSVESDLQQYASQSSMVDDLVRRNDRHEPLERQVQIFASDLGSEKANQLFSRLDAAGVTTAVFVLHLERGSEAVLRLADLLFG